MLHAHFSRISRQVLENSAKRYQKVIKDNKEIGTKTQVSGTVPGIDI